jgi:uncharacterized protein
VVGLPRQGLEISMPTLFRACALALICFVLPLHAQQTYKRWWQYENQAAKLTPEQFRLVLQQAEQGDVEAEMLISAAYQQGIGVEKSLREGLLWMQRAAEHGAPEGQQRLSALYRRGTEFFAPDMQKHLTWTRRAAEQGHIVAMHNLGNYYLEGISKVLPKDVTQGELWLTRSAEAGFPNALYLLGAFYMNGRYRTPDLEKAEFWLRKGSERGHVLALITLARLYAGEDSAPRDPDFVERILLQASEMRRPEAQYFLARMYRNGTLGVVNLPAAIEWLQISAAKKYAPSQFLLGELTEKGEGLPANPAAAVQLYQEAASLGYSPAVCKIAQSYYRGQGIPQSNADAYKWFLIGSRMGAPECAAGLKKLESELHEKERLRLTESTEAWIHAHPQAMAQPLGKFRWPYGVMVSDDPPPDLPPSTLEEREKLVKLVARLEAVPFGKEAREDVRWIDNWMDNVPDIFFLSCTNLLELPEAKSDYPHRPLLEQQMRFSGAAYQVQHPERKDQLAIYHAGVLGMARAYEAILAKDPKARWAVMDIVLELRSANALRRYVHQQANKNCR